MANHRAANAARVLGNATAAGGATLAATWNPVLAGVAALGGGIAGGVQNVREHRARKKAENMAKKALKNDVSKANGGKKGNKNEWWNGRGESVQQIPNLTPEQIASNEALRPGVLQQLQSTSNYDFAPQEAKSRANFAKYTRPGIAEMFKAHGGGANSDAYENALGVAQAEHETGLDILRNEHGFRQQQQQQNLAQNLFSQIQQPQFTNLHTPATGGLKGGLLEAAPGLLNTGVQAITQLGTAYAGARGLNALTQQAAPQTIGSASTPAGQAASNIAASTAGANVTGGAKTGAQAVAGQAARGGLTTAGRVVGGVGLGLAGLAATNWIVNQLRGGQQ